MLLIDNLIILSEAPTRFEAVNDGNRYDQS